MSFSIRNDFRNNGLKAQKIITTTAIANEFLNLTRSTLTSGNIDIVSSNIIISSSATVNLSSSAILTINPSMFIINASNTLFSGVVEMVDNLTNIVNDNDNTKIMQFDTSAIANSTTRTFIMPNGDVDLGGRRYGSFYSNASQNLSSGIQTINLSTKAIELGGGTPQYVLASNEITFGGSGNLQISYYITVRRIASPFNVSAYAQLNTGSGYADINGSGSQFQHPSIQGNFMLGTYFYLQVLPGYKLRFIVNPSASGVSMVTTPISVAIQDLFV